MEENKKESVQTKYREVAELDIWISFFCSPFFEVIRFFIFYFWLILLIYLFILVLIPHVISIFCKSYKYCGT